MFDLHSGRKTDHNWQQTGSILHHQTQQFSWGNLTYFRNKWSLQKFWITLKVFIILVLRTRNISRSKRWPRQTPLKLKFTIKIHKLKYLQTLVVLLLFFVILCFHYKIHNKFYLSFWMSAHYLSIHLQSKKSQNKELFCRVWII